MIPVVDVFAGPGGLNEGFASFRADGEPVFDIAASFEMEPNAVNTLKLRSAVRQTSTPDSLHPAYASFLRGRSDVATLLRDGAIEQALARADRHIHRIELGPESREVSNEHIRTAIGSSDNWVLIGGPPCQAYSLVGRSRRRGDENFAEDKKHFLYREYLEIIRKFRPAVFVMENVKGLLSAGHGGSSMFERIMSDFDQAGGYTIRSLATNDLTPSKRDYVLRAERFGVPQARHRVILLGLRNDLAERRDVALTPAEDIATVRQALCDLPKIRARVSGTSTDVTSQGHDWDNAHRFAMALAVAHTKGIQPLPEGSPDNDNLKAWLIRLDIEGVLQHESRAHMGSDLSRYAYLAQLAKYGQSPRIHDLPNELLPNHRNVFRPDTPFVDRFKVQRWDHPSGTVASHISKDGHYYIHPDPGQMRSLSVREAARLQTFPDDYYFSGNRTMQYHQVGNAVPPLLAHKIATKVAEIIGQ